MENLKQIFSKEIGEYVSQSGAGNTNFSWNKDGIFARDGVDPVNKYIRFFKDSIFSTIDNGVTKNFNLEASGSLSLTGDIILPLIIKMKFISREIGKSLKGMLKQKGKNI